jgi:3-hydroxyacyl-[acyl-carrier-protein] dehydratase
MLADPAPGLRLLEARSGGGTERFTIEASPDSPFFTGHFPDRPLLPAVAQLLLVARLCERGDARPRRVSEVESLRLRRPIGPRDVLDVMLECAEGGAVVRFEIRDARGLVSEGRLRRSAIGEG